MSETWKRVSYDALTKSFIFEEDRGHRSCGESRSDWTVVAITPAKTFVQGLERLLTLATDYELL